MKTSCCQHARLLLSTFLLLGWPLAQHADVLVRIGTADSAIGLQANVESYLGDLSGTNGLTGGSGSIPVFSLNLDSVPTSFSSPNYLPVDYFSIASPQGLTFSTPGSGVQVSARSSSGVPVCFGNFNPAYSSSFQTYQSERLLAPVGSTVIDLHFSLAGSLSAPGTVRGFGAVFSDVDLAGSTSIEFFDVNGESLFYSSVPRRSGGLSFLGVTFLGDEQVASGRLTLGNALLGSTDQGSQDVVTLAGLYYGEPQAVPEVVPLKLMALGLGTMVVLRWRRRRMNC